ncbi:hypothetical protein [Aeromonas hydrophila]|uniref:hypothetical protein n=1 Tax=Aeromonas hydrophila TaxID=644 RepID=UPI003F67B237
MTRGGVSGAGCTFSCKKSDPDVEFLADSGKNARSVIDLGRKVLVTGQTEDEMAVGQLGTGNHTGIL